MEPKMKPLLAQFYTEIQVLRVLNPHNIIHMVDYVVSESKIRIVIELMQGGELFDYIVAKGTLSEGDASNMVRKVINKKMLDPKTRTLLVAQFYNEIQVLRVLKHPNIIHMVDYVVSESKIRIVIELMQGGELFDYIVAKGTLSEGDASNMVRKVTSGLAYMHSMNVMHRDMKPENLMLATKGANPEIKIIDFGLSKRLRSSNGQECQFVGTGGYLSPEMLQRRPYTKAIDVWGLGVIVYALLCGCLPFDDDISVLDHARAKKKFDLRFPTWAKDISSYAKDLLSQLLAVNPQARMTAKEALQHPWVTGLKAGANEFLESPRTLRRLRAKGFKMVTVGREAEDGRDEDEAAGLLSGAAAMAAAREAILQAEFQEQKKECMSTDDLHPRKHSI